MIKAIHKPEAWRRERKFLTLGAEFISSHPSFISLKLFFVKLGKVPFPRRTTLRTNFTSEKSEKQPPRQKSEKHFRLIPPEDQWQSFIFQVHYFSKLTWTKWMNKDLSDCINQTGNRWECQQRGLKGFIFLHFKATVASSNSFSWENWWMCPGLGLGGSRRGSVGTWQAWARAGLCITLEKGREEDAKGSWMFPGTGLTHKIFPLMMPYQTITFCFFEPNWKNLDSLRSKQQHRGRLLLSTEQHLPNSCCLKSHMNWCEVWKSLSFVWLFATPWTIQSMEFFRPKYWSG